MCTFVCIFMIISEPFIKIKQKPARSTIGQSSAAVEDDNAEGTAAAGVDAEGTATDEEPGVVAARGLGFTRGLKI